MYKLILIIAALVMTSSCTKMKEKLGVTTTGPNEYQVQRNKGLEVPPHYDLPEPYRKSNAEPTAVEAESKVDAPESLTEGEASLAKEINKK